MEKKQLFSLRAVKTHKVEQFIMEPVEAKGVEYNNMVSKTRVQSLHRCLQLF